LIYDTKTKEDRRCSIGKDFDFEKVETYFKLCGVAINYDLLGGKDFKDYYISKMVSTKEFLSSFIRKRNSSVRYDAFTLALRG